MLYKRHFFHSQNIHKIVSDSEPKKDIDGQQMLQEAKTGVAS